MSCLTFSPPTVRMVSILVYRRTSFPLSRVPTCGGSTWLVATTSHLSNVVIRALFFVDYLLATDDMLRPGQTLNKSRFLRFIWMLPSSRQRCGPASTLGGGRSKLYIPDGAKPFRPICRDRRNSACVALAPGIYEFF